MGYSGMFGVLKYVAIHIRVLRPIKDGDVSRVGVPQTIEKAFGVVVPRAEANVAKVPYGFSDEKRADTVLAVAHIDERAHERVAAIFMEECQRPSEKVPLPEDRNDRGVGKCDTEWPHVALTERRAAQDFPRAGVKIPKTLMDNPYHIHLQLLRYVSRHGTPCGRRGQESVEENIAGRDG